jgi:hypothetical protein
MSGGNVCVAGMAGMEWREFVGMEKGTDWRTPIKRRE